VVVVATTRFCGHLAAPRQHIPVVISVSFRVVLLMFDRSSVFPERNVAVTSGYVSNGLKSLTDYMYILFDDLTYNTGGYFASCLVREIRVMSKMSARIAC